MYWCVLAVAVLSVAQAEKNSAASEKILKRFVDEFVLITPGQGKFPASFKMGSMNGTQEEQPDHEVHFKYAFAIGKYEVTQELYEAIMGKNPSRWQGPRNSVEMVSWDEAKSFCHEATSVLRELKLIEPTQVIRLASEAEWEYACRAGTQTAYSFGDTGANLTDYCWFTGNAKGNDPPVGAKKPNAWDLYDMHGYVWEWCSDSWHGSYKGAPTDGAAWVEDGAKERVLRGGAWTEAADRCRSAARHREPIEKRTAAIGFRCVLTSRK